MSGALVLVGDKLGFYRTLAKAVPLAPTSLAARTGTAPRYVREWSAAQAAGSAHREQPHRSFCIPIQKMFTHTAADRAGFRCRHIESIFIVSGAARATQYLSDVGAWCENRGLRGDDLVVLLRGCRKFRVYEPYEEA